MRICLLGTGGYYPNDHRHTACIWIPDHGLVLDAGTGIYRLNQLPAQSSYELFLSHAHLDHVIGLTYLLPLTLATTDPPRIRVHATSQTLATVREHLFAERLFPIEPPLDMVELAPVVELERGARVTSFPQTHPGGSTGFRIDFPHGRSLAYVTDTTAELSAPYVAQIRDVDLLIHECYFAGDSHGWAEQTGHSEAARVAEVAAAARCRRLVLVHLDPRLGPDGQIDLTLFHQRGIDAQIGHDLLELDL